MAEGFQGVWGGVTPSCAACLTPHRTLSGVAQAYTEQCFLKWERWPNSNPSWDRNPNVSVTQPVLFLRPGTTTRAPGARPTCKVSSATRVLNQVIYPVGRQFCR